MMLDTERTRDVRFEVWIWTRPFLCFLFLLVSASERGFTQSSLEQVFASIERGDYSLAESAFSQNPRLSLLKGILQFHRGDYTSAQATLSQILQQNDHPHARLFLALSQAATGGCDAARAELERQFSARGNSDTQRLAGLALSQCYLSSGRYSEAFGVLARLEADHPSNADVLYQSAKLHMKAWNDAVFKMFEKTPASFRVNQLSAEIFEIQGKYAEAIVEHRKAIEKNPAALNLHFRLGRALLMESHSAESLEAARREFLEELRLNPSDAVAEYQVGQVLVAQQNRAEAVRRYERAVELNPQFAEAVLALGKIRGEQKRFDESVELLRQAVHLLPRSEAARYALMIAYRNAGKTLEALKVKESLEQLQRPPEGEFTEFLKRLGETPKTRQ